MRNVIEKMPEWKVIFYDDGHAYFKGERQIPSVGSILKQFIPKFKGDFWKAHKVMEAEYGAVYKDHLKQIPKWYLDTNFETCIGPFLEKMGATKFMQKIQEIDGQWSRKRNDSAYFGSKFHAEQEEDAYTRGVAVNRHNGKYYRTRKHNKVYDNETLFENPFEEAEDGAYPEFLVYDEELLPGGVCGQVDLLFIETIDGIRYVDLDDYKTNEKDKLFGKSGKVKKTGFGKMLPPVDNLYASEYFKYNLQVSLYAYMLERMGFTPRNLGITYVEDYDHERMTLIPMDYLKVDVRSMTSEIVDHMPQK